MSRFFGVWRLDSGPLSQEEAVRLAHVFDDPRGGVAQHHEAPGLWMTYAGRESECGQSHNGDCCLWDGRLDNRREILRQTALPPDSSAGAMALAFYQSKGISGLRELLGDWSLCIRDAGRRKIILASDHAGIRPLYYRLDGGRLCWSTSLADVVRWRGSTELDPVYLATFLMGGSSAPRTPYAGISFVPPGHAVCADENGVASGPFWSLPWDREIRYPSERSYEEHLLELFREAVQVRLAAGAPTCAELSGGLDSSSVVCMAHRVLAERAENGLHTFSYTHENCPDERYFREIESVCRVSPHHLELPLFPAVDAQSGGAAPTWWVPRFEELSRRMGAIGSGVLLTGQFGDLIMGNSHDDTDQVAEELARGNLATAARSAYAWARCLRVPIYPILWRSLRQSCTGWIPPVSPRAGVGAIRTSTEDSLAPGLLAQWAADQRQRTADGPWREAPPGRRRRFRAVHEMLQSRSLQAPEALQHVSFTHPYAHRPLMEFMLAVPARLVCAPNEPRRLMKSAFSGLLPPLVLNRKSKAAYTSVYMDALLRLAAILLREPDKIQLVERGYLDRKSLINRLERFKNGVDCNESQLRQVLVLEFWLRNREAAGGASAAESGAPATAAGSRPG